MRISKTDIDGTKILLVDGVPQSTVPPSQGGYWQHMVPEGFSGRKVLVLGVGAGTIPRLLLEKYPNLNITGVDNNSLILTTAREKFHLDDVKMKVVIEDGFEYVRKAKEKFDLIVVDMWDGYWFPFKVLSKDFIEDCKKILNEGGWIYVNTPNLDYLAAQSFEGGLRDDIGQNIIYRLKK